HRDLAVFATQFGAFIHRALRDFITDVAPKEITQALALVQATHHFIKAGLENTQFGAIVDIDFDVALTAAHAVDGILKLINGVYHAHGGICRGHGASSQSS